MVDLYSMAQSRVFQSLSSGPWFDPRALAARVVSLCNVNSGSVNQPGVERVARRAIELLNPIADRVERVALPARERVDDKGALQTLTFTDAVVATCRADAPRRVLLSIHMDTVYAPDDPFQSVDTSDPGRYVGPGVADAKGGLVVMLAALEAYEATRKTDDLGWQVVLNPDEELGSIASAGLLQELAGGADWGLAFEPALPDGGLIDRRGGSGNFDVVVRGRSAHAGRNFTDGRNAVEALCRLFVELSGLSDPASGVTLNLGRITGGGAVNVVPDLAVGRFNVRVRTHEQMHEAETAVREMVSRHGEKDGLSFTLYGGFSGPPKPLDASSTRLLERILDTAEALGMGRLPTRASGGVSDGNKLAAAGLAVIDTLGPVGGAIHSDSEYLIVPSLAERARLAAALLHAAAEAPNTFPCKNQGNTTP